MKIFIINANEFIGQSLIPIMLEQGCDIVAGYNPSAVDQSNFLPDQPNLSKLKLDELGPQEFLPCLAECDCVVYFPLYHHAAREQFESATYSTQTLLHACVKAQVKKFIYISSTSVYGDPPPSGLITEESPYLASINPQTSIQQAVEKLILETDMGNTEVVVLQPSLIYGPRAGETTQILNQMKAAFIPLARSGTGYCHPIYIDDVVTAIIRACEVPSLHRQRFIISPNQAVTWREFFSGYESIIGEKSLIDLPIDYVCNPQDSICAFRAFASKLLTKGKVMRTTSSLAKAFYGKPIHYLSPDEFRRITAQPLFSNLKSRDCLGFQPKVSLQTGLESIRQWWQQKLLESQ
jgi:nucleoside-diphosphate-sugar epimerase